jgi:hypothetical protein
MLSCQSRPNWQPSVAMRYLQFTEGSLRTPELTVAVWIQLQTEVGFSTKRVAVGDLIDLEPGWRNWQTQRTQNPPTFGSWGFDPPSRHHSKKPRIRGLAGLALRMTCPLQQTRRTFRQPSPISINIIQLKKLSLLKKRLARMGLHTRLHILRFSDRQL